MSKTKSSTDSASLVDIAKLTGKPNQNLAAIQEYYKQEQERQIQNYASASEDKVLRKIRDVTKSVPASNLRTTDKKKIKSYLNGNIFGNSVNLMEASRYLYYRSPIYAQIIDKYVSMYCLDCRKIEIPYTFSKGLDSKAMKILDNTLDFLDLLSLPNNIQGPLLDMWINDISFNLFFKDETGCMFYPVDPKEAVIDSIYTIKGGTCLGFAIDMSKYNTPQRQQLIEWLGSPLKELWDEYKRTNNKYVHVPAEYSLVLKKRINDINTIIPPLLPYLLQFAGLNDLADSQNEADNLSFYRMIYMPLKTLSGAKNSDDWEITPDLAMDYFKIAADKAFPDGVSSAVIPGDELKTIDFSDNIKEEVNRVESTQQQILGGMSGMGALINASKAINNTALVNASLRIESAYALYGVLAQLTAWTNIQLLLELGKGKYCYTEYLPVTIFTKEDYRKTLHEANTYAFSYRLAYGTLLGFTERQTMGSLMFENSLLGLPDIMRYPLQSSYTSSNDGTEEVGRPQTPDEELTPSGERSRNK